MRHAAPSKTVLSPDIEVSGKVPVHAWQTDFYNPGYLPSLSARARKYLAAFAAQFHLVACEYKSSWSVALASVIFGQSEAAEVRHIA